MSRFKIRVRYVVKGGHVHMRVFTGRNFPDSTLGKAGELVMGEDEFQEWQEGTITTEFDPEEDA
jgi:hypothetical protein